MTLKSLLIVAMFALCSCATGVVDPIEDPIVVVTPPPNKTAPAPPEKEKPTGQADCVIDAYWVGNCYVVKIYCKNKPTQTEVACGPGRPLWPWEIDPYPPPYENPEN